MDAVNVYGGEKSAVFDEMISNSSGYMTIIIEDPQLTASEVNITGLQYFLHTGGIVIFEGNPQMISSGFLMHTASDAGRDGVLKDTEAFNSPYNSTVKFSASNWYFYQLQGDSTLNLDIEDQNTAGGAFAGYWNYEIGKIYYITDIDGSINSQNLSSIENIIGGKAEISSGTINNAFSYTKPIVFDTDLNSLGTMIMVIGK